MNIFTLILISFSLTFDTFAVSVSSGIADTKIKFWQAVKIAFIFALFQGGMPFIGWLVGEKISVYLSHIDHFIAFSLLFAIGIKMICEALKNEDRKSFNPYSYSVIITLGIATSIDALIVGISFAFIKVNILFSVLLIGFLTFLVAMIGMLVGKKAGEFIGNKAEILGGIILIGIGLKILLENIL